MKWPPVVIGLVILALLTVTTFQLRQRVDLPQLSFGRAEFLSPVPTPSPTPVPAAYAKIPGTNLQYDSSDVLAAEIVSLLTDGQLDNAYFDAYANLQAKDRLDNDSGSDILTRAQADARYAVIETTDGGTTSTTTVTTQSATQINDLTDVDATGPSANQVLKFNADAGNWSLGNDDNTTYGAGSGLTLTGSNNFEFGGDLAGDVTIGLSTYDWLFTGTGNLGLGTTAPAYKLDVNGDLRIASGSDLYMGTTALSSSGGASKIGVNSTGFGNSTSSNLQTLLSDLDTAITSSSTGDITAVGDIVNGAAFTSGTPGSQLYFADTGFLGLGASAARLEFYDDTTDTIALMGGNVGIGTTEPSSRLNIAGDSGTASEGITFGDSGDVNLYRVNAALLATDDWFRVSGQLAFGSSGDTTLYRNAANALRTEDSFVVDGNVGIGTTAPDSLLSLAFSPASTPAFKVLNKDNANQAILQLTTASNNARLMLWDASNNQDIQIYAGGDSWFNGGNVGIGTTNPTNLFTVGSGNNFGVDSDGFTAIGSAIDTTSKLKVQTNSSASSTYLRAGYFHSYLTGGGSTTYLTGLEAIANSNGNTSWGSGLQGSFNNNTGSTVSTANSLWLTLNNYAGTISTWNGIQISTPSIISGSVTTARGIYINSIAGATNNYSLVTNAGNVVFNEGGDADTDFRIEGDTDSNLFFVNAGTDRVGVGTAGPTYKLDINGTSNTVGARVASSTAGDILYYGTGTVTGDMTLLSSGVSASGAVKIDLANSNSSSSTANSIVRLATNSANSGDPFINFSITGQQDWLVGVDNSDSDKFKIGYSSNFNTNNAATINSAGLVGIRTADPQNTLHVAGTVRVDTLSSASDIDLCTDTNGVLSDCSSSIRYKDNIADLDMGLDTILAMRPVEFDWQESGLHSFGFVAEEMQAIDDRLVTYKDGQVEGVKYKQLTAVLTNAVQELNAEVISLKSQNAAPWLDLAPTQSESATQPGAAEDDGLILDPADLVQAVIDWLADATNEVVIAAQTTFNNVVTFTEETIFEGPARFTQLVEFGSGRFNHNLQVDGQLQLAQDQVGQLTIPAGQTEQVVQFEQPFSHAPIVVLTPVGDIAAFLQSSSTTLFNVRLRQVYDTDVVVNWYAFPGHGSGEVTAPDLDQASTDQPTQETPTSTTPPSGGTEQPVADQPTVTPTPQLTVTPTTEPTGGPEPTADPNPSPTPTTPESATTSAELSE